MSIKYEVIKEAAIDQKEIILSVKIRTNEYPGYHGYDLFPDDKLGELIVAVGRMFSHDKKWGHIKRKFRSGRSNES